MDGWMFKRIGIDDMERWVDGSWSTIDKNVNWPVDVVPMVRYDPCGNKILRWRCTQAAALQVLDGHSWELEPLDTLQQASVMFCLHKGLGI